ncbi:MAG: hypothetical protein Q8J85_07305 [Sulfuricurvum sp.]|nr:hypothetical protein [Sulfuricurvum sp.]MDP3022966.1 hypothetical protein [Sulfuricurvum sp.]
MIKKEKFQHIMEEFECGEYIARQIYDISEKLNTENYKYCKLFYDVSDETGIESISACRGILLVSRELNNENYVYCNTIIEYMRENLIYDTIEGEKAYKLEKEQN